MSKKQSSLMSFFKSSGTPTSSPKTSTPIRSRVPKEEETEECPLRAQCNKEKSMSPVKANGKRRRVIISSDEEDEENEAKRPAKKEPVTPKTPKTSSRAAPKTPKTADRSGIAESFISSFRFDDSMDTSMNSLINSVDVEDNNHAAIEADVYVHEKLPWLKPENIRDANKRKMDDPDYDPTTLLVPADFIKSQTPGHQQWWTIKSQNFDTVLLWKVGKFYETYHMDAVIAVNNLGLAYMRGAHAHAGFPEAAYGKFADQLVTRGYKVARVEQTETPQQLEERNANARGSVKEKVVKRELCRITTAGTKTYGVHDGDIAGLDAVETGNKYLFALQEKVTDKTSTYGVCFIDTSIGEFHIGQFEDDDYRSFLRTILAKYSPVQLLLERGHLSSQTAAIINTMLTSVPKEYLAPKKQFLTADTAVKELTKHEYLGSEDWPEALKEMLDQNVVVPKPAREFDLAWSTLGAVLGYLRRCLIDVDMVSMKNFIPLRSTLASSPPDNTENFWKNRNLVLDGITIFNLNLIPSTDAQASSLSLYNVMNNCSTPFGRRLLRQWICSPSCDPDILGQRQQAVEFLYATGASSSDMKNMSNILKGLPDFERLIQNPGSYELIKTLLSSSIGDELENFLQEFNKNIDLKKAMDAGKVEPNAGADKDYDDAVAHVEECVAELQEYRVEQEKVLKCKIVYWGSGRNSYQMEIPDTKNVPSQYQLKSRKKGYGRYYTPDLERLIEKLGRAEDHREKQIAESSRKVFEEFASRKSLWSQIVDKLSTLDVILCFANYAKSSVVEVCRPDFDYNAEKPFITIENGSHPSFLAQIGAETNFIANDVCLGGKKPSTMLLTGPNMGGKSTLMRQVAVLTVMAHMGSLVPAKSMKLSPVDRIFTRIGANDRIMCGQSTFFVEMNETQIIMRDATKHSLVLVDELGRGTSTFDGTAIASAVLNEFASNINCRTFFSTHYHSLCNTAATNTNICQAHMACMVENENDEDPTEESVTFLYKLADGACPKSYGFYAAKLAGISDDVVRHAYIASSRIAGGDALDVNARDRLRKAAASGVDIEDLRKMVEAL